jgi:translation initiation factor 2B subunit (eIF-2B alpha/beta/delta family)
MIYGIRGVESAEDLVVREAISRFLQEIRNDNRSGASQIAEKAAHCLLAFVEGFQGRRQPDFMGELQAVGREIMNAQPAMAPLFNLVNDVLLKAERVGDLGACKEAVAKEAGDFKRALEIGWEAMVEPTWSLVRDGSMILVHSCSGTLYRVLVTLHDRGRGFTVTCTESRPQLEGVTLARRLADQGILVRLIVDSAAFQLLEQSDLVLVGADAISPLGVTNKIGTRGIAMAAACQDVPFYVLAGTEKCIPMDVKGALEEETRPAGEVFETGEAIEVLNFYFDRTPLQLVSGVITERGVWDTWVLKKYIEDLRVHPVLGDWRKRRQ